MWVLRSWRYRCGKVCEGKKGKTQDRSSPDRLRRCASRWYGCQEPRPATWTIEGVDGIKMSASLARTSLAIGVTAGTRHMRCHSLPSHSHSLRLHLSFSSSCHYLPPLDTHRTHRTLRTPRSHVDSAARKVRRRLRRTRAGTAHPARHAPRRDQDERGGHPGADPLFTVRSRVTWGTRTGKNYEWNAIQGMWDGIHDSEF